jgi:sugar transferase (PEP-CTERM system associated)
VVRVFSHYISAKVVLLVVLEAMVLMLAVSAGFTLQRIGAGDIAGVANAVPPPAAALSIGVLIVINSMGLYQLDIVAGEQRFLVRSIVAVLLTFVLTALLVYSVPSLELGAGALAVMAAVAVTGSALVRFGFKRLDGRVALKSRVLVLGTGSRAMRLAELAQRNQNHVVIGYVSTQSTDTHYVPSQRIVSMAPGESLLSIVEKYKIDQIVIAVRDRRSGGLPVQDLLRCRLRGIKVTEMATFFECEYRQLLLTSLNASWMLLGDGFRQGPFRTVAKRIFDLTASTVLLILTLPIMAVSALAIYLESGFPLLYRQERIGARGKRFTIYKLRSMKNGAERDGMPRWAAIADDRITRVGKLIRTLRIDELPQIFNVFKGDMSFVGPRPERPYFVEQLEKQIPYYSIRHTVKPGITGWAQVRYPYGASVDDAVEKLQYDLYYVKNHSLFLDLVVLISTVEVVLWDKGAR